MLEDAPARLRTAPAPTSAGWAAEATNYHPSFTGNKKMSHSLSFTGVQGERLALSNSLQDSKEGLLVSVQIPSNLEFTELKFKSAGKSGMNLFRVQTEFS